jgi:hypothetical protein
MNTRLLFQMYEKEKTLSQIFIFSQVARKKRLHSTILRYTEISAAPILRVLCTI